MKRSILMDSIWNQSDRPKIQHLYIAIFFSFFFVAARFFLDSFVYKRLAIRLLTNGKTPAKNNRIKRTKIEKCCESMWKLTYYATVLFCVLILTHHEPWWRDLKAYFRGWPNQEIRFPLKLFYMCQCGFYLYSIVALLKWETRRKDFSIMMSHHIITSILIGYSYMTSFFRIGCTILALHDASDVFLEAAKLFKYSENDVAASVFFAIFALSWLLLRLIYFPFWIIRATSHVILGFLSLSSRYHFILYYTFNSMLLLLLMFHLYWWMLICAMIRKQLSNRGKVGGDIRSDSENDD